MSRTRAIVLGGTGNLGMAVCRALAAREADIVCSFHTNESAAIALTKELGLRAFRTDLASVAEIETTIDRARSHLGGIDALIHCAAIGKTPGTKDREDAHQRMADIGEKDWDLMTSVNVKSAFFACRAVFDTMKAGKGGNIVLVSSIDGVKAAPSPVHYAATKGALCAMAMSMAKEFGQHAIRVNAIAPGVMEGGISNMLPVGLVSEYLKHCGLKRRARFSEIAEVVSWLALDNTYVTGQTIVLDGAL